MSARSVSYKRHRFPRELIAHAMWLYFRFPLSFRLIEEMLLERGIIVSHETVRRWSLKFGAAFARRLPHKRAAPGEVWHLDEVRIVIRGQPHWLWRAVDQDGYRCCHVNFLWMNYAWNWQIQAVRAVAVFHWAKAWRR